MRESNVCPGTRPGSAVLACLDAFRHRQAGRAGAVAAVGLALGVATSVLQQHLHLPWESLVNAGAPWLAGMFAVGAMWERSRQAALSGLAVGLFEFGGYSVTAALRAYPAGTAALGFWAVCAVAGGPLFGAAGWLWWRGPARLSSLGATLLPASFLTEALVVYDWRLHSPSSALLFVVLGALAVVATGLHGRQFGRVLGWLPAVLSAGLIAELAVSLLYQRAL